MTANLCRKGEIRFKIRVHYARSDGLPICGNADLSPTNRTTTATREVNCAWCRKAVGLNAPHRGKATGRSDR